MSYNYDLDFQRGIIASCYLNHEFLKENHHLLNPSDFSDEILSGIGMIVLEFYKTHEEVPKKSVLLQEVKSVLAPGRSLYEYEEEILRSFKQRKSNTLYFQSKALEFSKSQSVFRVLQEGRMLLEEGKLGEIKEKLDQALSIANEKIKESYNYFKSAKDRISDYLSKDKNQEKRIRTGLPPLDEMIQGGLGPGELGVIVALPKHGKTTTLINFAYHALMDNKSVAYVTLELSKKMIATKFDVRIFGKNLMELKEQPVQFARILKDLHDKLTGNLYIIEYPTKSIGVETLEQVLHKNPVDIMLIDYGQLLKSSSRREERRHELSDVYEALRGLAGKFSIPIWTAHQANRPGTNAKILLPEHIAEDFNIIAIADIGISINFTEQERRQGLVRVYNMASRLGPCGEVIECGVDFATSNLYVQTGGLD